jgi:hypothetical protein
MGGRQKFIPVKVNCFCAHSAHFAVLVYRLLDWSAWSMWLSSQPSAQPELLYDQLAQIGCKLVSDLE